MPTPILLVEDNAADARLIRQYLAARMPSAEVTHERRLSAALEALRRRRFDVLLLDVTLPDSHGLTTFTRVHHAAPDTGIIVLTGHTDDALAIDCLRNGAQDYLVKQHLTEELLVRTIQHAKERKRIELALRESEENYRGLFENAPHGIFRSDMSGNFLDVNDALIKMLRYDAKSEVLALDVATDVFESETEHHRMLLADGGSGDMAEDVRWKRRDGRTINVRLTGRGLHRDDGKRSGCEVIVEDVTDRRLLEERFLQAQKMEAVGQLTGGIAHELNNVLSVILADAQFVEGQLTNEDAGVRRDVEEIKAVADRGGALIKKLLGFSRRQRLTVQTVDLAQIISGTATMLERLFPEYIQIALKPCTPPYLIEADPGTVEQILLNLATNARDAMPDGGTMEIQIDGVTIDQAYVDLHPEASIGEKVVIRVPASGIGMDAATLAYVLEPFFTTKSKGEGTGLGLSTVYGLVQQQQGFMTIDSEPGGGTTVSMYFPRVAERRRTKRPTPEPVAVPNHGTETILLVEDEPALRRAGERALTAFGYSVITASDGVEGLERFREHADTIDLIVTDVVMPGMNGRAMYERIRRVKPSMGVVFTSGYSTGDLRRGNLLPGQYRLVEKPWNPSNAIPRGKLPTALNCRSPLRHDPLAALSPSDADLVTRIGTLNSWAEDAVPVTLSRTSNYSAACPQATQQPTASRYRETGESYPSGVSGLLTDYCTHQGSIKHAKGCKHAQGFQRFRDARQRGRHGRRHHHWRCVWHHRKVDGLRHSDATDRIAPRQRDSDLFLTLTAGEVTGPYATLEAARKLARSRSTTACLSTTSSAS
jgi:PAS domain S-box-containing protein